ncbi:MAG: iron complex outermembrane receptor protein [Marinoscillum sp.]|jgi:iron complex outermembrane receptor protein
MLKSKILFFALGIFCMQVLLAQRSISGSLVDAVENSPIGFASLALYKATDSTLVGGAISEEDGSFLLADLKVGAYYLSIQFMGFNPKELSVDLTKVEKVDLGTIALSPDQKMLDEIEVTGASITMLHKVDRQVFNSSAFQSAQGGTAVDLLRNLPSLAVNANGEITVRGSSGFTILLNGKPVQSDPQMLLAQLPANAIAEIEVITSPSSKYDPEGKAGIINIKTTRGSTDGLFTLVNVKAGAPSIQDYDNAEYAQRYGADFTINYIKGKWDLSAGASYLRNDLAGRREGDVFTIINDTTTRFPSDGERSFDEVNYSGRFTLGYAPSESDYFSIGAFAGKRSKDRTADILYYNNTASYQGNTFRTLAYYNENLRIRTSDFALGSFDYSHIFDDASKFSASFLYEYTLLGGPTTNRNLDWPNTSVVLQDEYNTNDNPLFGTRLQLDYQFKPLSFGTFEMGYQFRNLDHKGDFVYERKNNTTGIFELVPDFSSEVNLRRKIHSGYFQLSKNDSPLSYSAGLRLEAMDRELDLKDKAGLIDTTYSYDFIQLYPSLSLNYKVSENLTIKTAYSRRVERTTTFKMNPFREREHSETMEQGDPELRPEFINLIEFGAIQNIGNQSIFATAYFRDVQNLVNRVNTIFNDTILDRIYSNVGVGRSYGLEIGSDLLLSKSWKGFIGGNIYRNQIEGSFRNESINTSSWIYSINANTLVKWGNSWSAQWTLNYISARNTAQGEDSRYLSPNLTLRKTFLEDRLSVTAQWLNMDMGLLDTNEQRITTSKEGAFYTTTNYVYEVDMIMLNVSYTFNKLKNKAKFIKSEFGAQEF